MQLTTTLFKRAAQRLAKNTSVPLSAAHEQLATAFGFRNLDDLLHKLSGNSASLASPGASIVPLGMQPPPIFWGDLTFSEFSLLLHSFRIERPQGDSGNWFDKSTRVLNAVISQLQHDQKHDLTSYDLTKAFSLKEIELAYVESVKKYGLDSGVWPLKARQVGRYLETGCPAYKVDRLLGKNGLLPAERAPTNELARKAFEQDHMALEQHDYRVDFILPFTDLCEAIDERGGPNAVLVPAPQSGSNAGAISLKEWLATCSVSRPSEAIVRQMREAVITATEGDIFSGMNRYQKLFDRELHELQPLPRSRMS